MEIQSLKLFLTEDEVNELVQEYMPSREIENLRVRLKPEGVIVQGEYPTMMMRISFETIWELSVAGPEIRARLTNVQVAGLPATLLRKTLLSMIREDLTQQPGIRVEDDLVIVHVEEAARPYRIGLRVRFTEVRCSFNSLVLEAG